MRSPCVAAVLIAAMIIAADAGATTVKITPPTGDSRWAHDGYVDVEGDDGGNSIGIWFRRDRYTIRDSDSRIRARQCRRIGRHGVRCRKTPGHDLLVSGEKGADRISVHGRASGLTYLFGDGGRDVVKGSDGRDEVAGGRGPDVVRGRRGRDEVGEVLGDKGKDRLLGGPGRDTMWAAGDRVRDRLIDCGSGRGEYAIISRPERSRTKNCRDLNVAGS